MTKNELKTPPEPKNPSILMYGDACVGKSFSLATLLFLKDIRPGMRVVLVSTEKNSIRGVVQGLSHYGINLEDNQLIFVEVRPTQKKAFKAKLNAIKSFASDTVSESYSTDKDSNANKDKYTYLVDIITKLETLKGVDYKTKKEVNLGNVSDLTERDVLCIDGLSPLVHGIWNIVQGDRLVNDHNDYQVVQKQVYDICNELVNNISCALVILAHQEEGKDKLYHPAISCGQALHSKFMGIFTDTFVCYTTTIGGYLWAGRKVKYSTATRDLPNRDKLKPNFSLYNLFHDDGIN